MTPYNFDKKIIANNFSKAASHYDEAALIQNIAAKKLCDITLPFIKNNSHIIDIGSGTSWIYKHLTSSPNFCQKNLKLFEIDLSPHMLSNWQDKSSHNICSIIGDGEHLPFKPASFDVIISSFSLQWFHNINKVLADFYHILKEDGILAICIPNYKSFEEVKKANIESGCNFYFSDLPKIADIKTSLMTHHFQKKYLESETTGFEFKNVLDFMKSLKKIGANYSENSVDRRNKISKEKLQHFDRLCLKTMATANKKLAISWNVSYLVFYKDSH